AVAAPIPRAAPVTIATRSVIAARRPNRVLWSVQARSAREHCTEWVEPRGDRVLWCVQARKAREHSAERRGSVGRGSWPAGRHRGDEVGGQVVEQGGAVVRGGA